MKHQHVKAFVQVADSGSIRAAARALRISQSALTRSMKELEEDVGAELLNRSYRGVTFTEAGKALLGRLRMILATMERARDEIQQMSGGAGAHVSIGITPVVATTIFPSVYRQFVTEFPDAVMTLKEGFMTEIVPGLLEGELDFGVAISTRDVLPPELDFIPLCPTSLLIAGREGHPLAKEKNWAALSQARWILNLTNGSTGHHLLYWLEREGLPKPRHIVQCTSPTLMMEMMRRTDLVGFGPDRLLTDPLVSCGVTIFQAEPRPPAATLGLFRVRGVPLTPVAQKLQTWFERAISNDDRSRGGRVDCA